MMKRLIKDVIIALAFTFILPLHTAAAQAGDSIEVDESGNVTVTSDHEEGSQITALQLSLKIEADPEAEIAFDFNPENSIKISEYRYHEESKHLNIYIADPEPVFDSLGSLNIGAVSAKDSAGNTVEVKADFVEGSLKYVHGDILEEQETTVPETTEETTAATTDPVTTETTTAAIPETTEETAAASTHIASDEEFCEWAIKDYRERTGAAADKAEISENSKGQYNITLYDDTGKVLDNYVIDPETGIGVNSADKEVNLPQTGNHSIRNILIVFGAFLLLGLGIYTVKISGVMDRKKNEK